MNYENINGTLVWYYGICKREVWLMSRQISPDQKDTNIEIGRFIHENVYNRNKKEIEFGNVKFDVILNTKEQLIIGETKKTSKFQEASRLQLIYYLRELKKANIKSSGVLLYPEERKRVDVVLDELAIKEIEQIEMEILELINSEKPIPVEKNKYCKNCAYREYCYA